MSASTVSMTDRYAIDAGMSRFTVKAFASGMLSALGHNPTLAIREFSGEARFTPDTLAEASLQFRIKANSLTVTDNISDKDRREIELAAKQDVLEAAQYPEIVFESSSVSATGGDGQYQVNFTGNLALHGVTSPQTLSARVSLLGDTLRANGQFSLLQSAFRIKPVSFAGGSLKLKDELKFAFDILARKQ